MTQNRRIFAVDVLRGVAICIVIFGHALQRVHGFYPPYHPVHQIILSFQMELFFAIAGYVSFLSQGGNVLASLGKKAKRLLVPYFTWVTLSFAIGLIKGNAHLDLLSVQRYYLLHQFWFLRTMFYACAIHIAARKVYSLSAFKEFYVVRATASMTTILFFSAFVRYVLLDRALPWYMIWFCIGFGIGPFIRFGNGGGASQQSWSGRFMALLGRKSLALYALHWWIFFGMLPIPKFPKCPEVLCALGISLAWLFSSLCLDAILSRVPMVSQMLLGTDKRIRS